MNKIRMFITSLITFLLIICAQNTIFAADSDTPNSTMLEAGQRIELNGVSGYLYCTAHGKSLDPNSEYALQDTFELSKGGLAGKDIMTGDDAYIDTENTRRLYALTTNPDIFGPGYNDVAQQVQWYLNNQIYEEGGKHIGWTKYEGDYSQDEADHSHNTEVDISQCLPILDELVDQIYGQETKTASTNSLNKVRNYMANGIEVSSYSTSPLTKAMSSSNESYTIQRFRSKSGFAEEQSIMFVETPLTQKEKDEQGNTDEPENPDEPGDCPGGGGKQTSRPGTVSLSGKVWEDQLTGKSGTNNDHDDGEAGVAGVKATWISLYDGSVIASTTTDGSGNYSMSATVNMYDHPYAMDASSYNRINNSYIEFEYDGFKYTTVAFDRSASNGSKGIELSETRTAIDNRFTEVNKNGPSATGHIAKASTIPSLTGITNLLDNAAKGSAEYCFKHCDTVHYVAGVCGEKKWEVVGSHWGVTGGHYEETFDEDGIHNGYEWVPEYGDIPDYDWVTYYCGGNHCLQRGNVVNSWTITNMNLGLVRREQPDMSLVSDIEKVDVQMKDQLYTYYYGERGIIASPDNYTGTKVQYEFKDVKDVYQRPINPSSIAEVKAKDTNDLKVYVTYNIKVKNEADTLTAVLHSIVNYYDNRYSLSTRDGANSGWRGTRDLGNGYTASYYTLGSPEAIAPGQYSSVIKLELEISQDTLKGLIDGNEQTLRDTSEIIAFSTRYGNSTICAEHSTAATKGRVGSLYAGLDLDSQPESAVPGNEGTYQDDTDTAPYFRIKQDDYKIITGTVYEDTNIRDNGERVGSGTQDNGEKTVQNVKVELYRVTENGLEIAKLYSAEGGSPTAIDAVTFTDENGNYSFGSASDGTKVGVPEDTYVIKYTYGNADKGEGYTSWNKEGIKTKIETTKIDGHEINARNYKSTVITNDTIKGVMQGNGNINWHLTLQDGVSIAVDDLNERLQIPSLTYSNFDTPVNMSAYTRPFKIQLQYTGSQSADVGADGGQFEHVSTVFDFGIVERPREDIVINKTISNLKITLANGQVLIDGNPYQDKLDYVQALGPKSDNPVDSRDDFKRNQEKLLKIEMDSELLQGAKVDIVYAITVTNNSEIDYEYEGNYVDTDIEQKQHITTDSSAKYYYYGDASGLSLIKLSAELVVDYVDSELTVELEEQQNENWVKVSVDGNLEKSTETTLAKEHLAEKTIDAVKDDKYLIFTTTEFKDIARGESKTINLHATKLLANQENEYTYENHTEIIQLNGKIARTIDSTKNGEQVEKTYRPGNYIPSLATRKVYQGAVNEGVGLHQQDDDMITIRITPPTGLSEYTIIYVIAGMVGLVAIVIGIYIIKKRVLGR